MAFCSFGVQHDISFIKTEPFDSRNAKQVDMEEERLSIVRMAKNFDGKGNIENFSRMMYDVASEGSRYGLHYYQNYTYNRQKGYLSLLMRCKNYIDPCPPSRHSWEETRRLES